MPSNSEDNTNKEAALTRREIVKIMVRLGGTYIEKAHSYVRVIEIPKPRWTAYDAKFFKVKMPKEAKMTVQDRAYTSPIWYTPSK